MDLELRGKCAVVVGGSKGIGLAIARCLARESADVAICARGERPLLEAERSLQACGGRVFAATCDAADGASLDGFLEQAHAFLGRIDILVNNASAFGFTDDAGGWQASFDVDVLAAVRACWKVVPWMADAGGGSIIHISSISGLEAGSPPAYAAAKAALVSHAKTLALSLAAKRIRVNAVAPGSIDFEGGAWDRVKHTNRAFYDRVVSSIPWGRMGNPDEVADVVAFVASDRARWMTGACVTVDGGQHRGNL